MRLFSKAAEAGHVPSMLDLALMYNTGEGGTADPFKAALWYKRAADLGSSAGMVNLGFMHQQGKGVEKNDITAVALYRRAAAEGNPSGIHNLAAMLDSGRGVARKDPEQAADLILQALEMRNEFSLPADDAEFPRLEPGFPPRAAEEAARCRRLLGTHRRRAARHHHRRHQRLHQSQALSSVAGAASALRCRRVANTQAGAQPCVHFAGRYGEEATLLRSAAEIETRARFNRLPTL